MPRWFVVAVLDPLLLHELELAGDAGVEGLEDDAAVLGVRDGLAIGNVATVGQTATGDAAAINKAAVEAERIAWIDAAEMGTHGAGACLRGRRRR